MKKDIAKSIRMTSKVYGYIMQAPGNGFNEKFENIILSAMESEPERVKRLESLDNQIESKRNQLYSMESSLRGLTPLVQAALHINSSVNEFNKKFEKLLEE